MTDEKTTTVRFLRTLRKPKHGVGTAASRLPGFLRVFLRAPRDSASRPQLGRWTLPANDRRNKLKGALQAPHINVNVLARGVLWHLFTRIYFACDPSNENDAILALVPGNRRDTLLARPDPDLAGIWNFDVSLSGDRETVFFEA